MSRPTIRSTRVRDKWDSKENLMDSTWTREITTTRTKEDNRCKVVWEEDRCSNRTRWCKCNNSKCKTNWCNNKECLRLLCHNQPCLNQQCKEVCQVLQVCNRTWPRWPQLRNTCRPLTDFYQPLPRRTHIWRNKLDKQFSTSSFKSVDPRELLRLPVCSSNYLHPRLSNSWAPTTPFASRSTRPLSIWTKPQCRKELPNEEE